MSNIMGYKFELYCVDMYRHTGKIGVAHNIQYNFRRLIGGSLVRKAQVDIEYIELPLLTATVECKYHENTNVGPEEVEGFIETLRMLDREYGTMITNSDYTSTAAKIAKKGHINLIDDDKLEKMGGLQEWLSPRSLEQRIRGIRVRHQDLMPKIRTVKVI
jgi:hypothetical protein